MCLMVSYLVRVVMWHTTRGRSIGIFVFCGQFSEKIQSKLCTCYLHISLRVLRAECLR